MQRHHHLSIWTVSLLLLSLAPMASAHGSGECTPGQLRSAEAHVDAETQEAKAHAKVLLKFRDDSAPAADRVEERQEELFWASVFEIFDKHDHLEGHKAAC